MFDRSVLKGEGFNGLDAPNEAVISRSLAQKYFGSEDVLGEVLKFGKNEFKITGVIEDAPKNTDLPFNLLLSYITVKTEIESAGWGSIWSDEQCYFLLKESESIAAVQEQLHAFLKKHDPESERRKASSYHATPE